MKPIPYLFTALICFLLSLKLSAQDYLIKTNGDTIKCTINVSLFGKAKYKITETAKSQKITVEDVREYFLAEDSTTFRVVSLDSTRQFLEMLEKGKVDIYESFYNNASYINGMMVGGTTVTVYILKTTDTAKDLKYSELRFSSKKRKELLAPMLIDNKAIYEKFIADDKFSFKAIRNIVHLYNTGTPFKERVIPPKKDEVETNNGFNPNQD